MDLGTVLSGCQSLPEHLCPCSFLLPALNLVRDYTAQTGMRAWILLSPGAPHYSKLPCRSALRLLKNRKIEAFFLQVFTSLALDGTVVCPIPSWMNLSFFGILFAWLPHNFSSLIAPGNLWFRRLSALLFSMVKVRVIFSVWLFKYQVAMKCSWCNDIGAQHPAEGGDKGDVLYTVTSLVSSHSKNPCIFL